MFNFIVKYFKKDNIDWYYDDNIYYKPRIIKNYVVQLKLGLVG